MSQNFEQAMEPVTRGISENYLGQMRSAAIGGGSFSAAIVLVLLQVGLSSVPLRISFYAAALGIPVWIVVWQYVQPYLDWPEFRRHSVAALRVAPFKLYR
ncbi:hypothetical protein [Xanthomonas translucens]|uniref:hypothetical protein n=1 Tax=Xanthomonas campestris pv. translucens TaxID=343 RepID=UPI001F298379|nr:hypothetical protein [Xanthomonas translucens]UJB15427.1 hypothetical protein LTC53_01575 [Xanthomonas translucens pv. undulosa]